MKKSQNINITFDEVLEELRKISEKSDEGFTAYEFGKAAGHNQRWAQLKIKKMIEEGKVVYNGTAKRPRIDRQLVDVPVYKLQ